MKEESGVALVQVLVMSVMLLVLSAGVMQIIFGTHVLVARAKVSDEKKMWIEACVNKKNESWAAPGPCGGSTSDVCDFSADQGPTVAVACVATAEGIRVSFDVTWN
mgnify:CR=1 FL=1